MAAHVAHQFQARPEPFDSKNWCLGDSTSFANLSRARRSVHSAACTIEQRVPLAATKAAHFFARDSHEIALAPKKVASVESHTASRLHAPALHHPPQSPLHQPAHTQRARMSVQQRCGDGARRERFTEVPLALPSRGVRVAERSHLPCTWSEIRCPPAFRRGGQVIKWLSLGHLRFLRSTALHALTAHSNTRGHRDQGCHWPARAEINTASRGTCTAAAPTSTSEGAAAALRPAAPFR